jgi:hypothetical protein
VMVEGRPGWRAGGGGGRRRCGTAMAFTFDGGESCGWRAALGRCRREMRAAADGVGAVASDSLADESNIKSLYKFLQCVIHLGTKKNWN